MHLPYATANTCADLKRPIDFTCQSGSTDMDRVSLQPALFARSGISTSAPRRFELLRGCRRAPADESREPTSFCNQVIHFKSKRTDQDSLLLAHDSFVHDCRWLRVDRYCLRPFNRLHIAPTGALAVCLSIRARQGRTIGVDAACHRHCIA